MYFQNIAFSQSSTAHCFDASMKSKTSVSFFKFEQLITYGSSYLLLSKHFFYTVYELLMICHDK